MLDSFWLEAVIIIGFGAAAGGITNWIAVMMLFHPYEPRRLGFFTLHGAIPKNKARLAKSIGKTVSQRLLTEEDLARQLSAPGLRQAFDGALTVFFDRAFNATWGPLEDELPPAVLAELQASLEPVAQAMAARLADFIEGPGFDTAIAKYVALERWVAEGVERPELEAAIRAFVAAQRDRALRDEQPLLDRMPRGVVAAFEQGVADYLPVAVERFGAAMANPVTRERMRKAFKKFLDRALRNMMVHERMMAKFVITEKRIDRLLARFEEDGLAELTEVIESAEFKAEAARAVNEAVVRYLRTPLADRLWALGSDRLDGLERAAADFIIGALRAPQTRAWAVARAADGVELARKAIVGESGRERLAEMARAAVRAMLARPLGRPVDLMPPDAETRMRNAVSEPMWGWMQRQVPVIVSQLSVQEMVEQKVLGFPTERVEEIIRGVTGRELQTIIRLGWLLGGIVGAAAFGLNRLLSL